MKTALFRPNRTLSNPARPNIRVIPPNSAKRDGDEPPTTEIYAILQKIRKLGALRPEICDLWPIFQHFSTYWHPNDMPGQYGGSKNVMFLSKNVMSFLLRGSMNTSHTFGKRTELYRHFYAGSPAP